MLEPERLGENGNFGGFQPGDFVLDNDQVDEGQNENLVDEDQLNRAADRQARAMNGGDEQGIFDRAIDGLEGFIDDVA